ncbi:uncharacterized protein TNCV_736181 [Trichonephila clavipes]|uniref:Uncharacterized protein n=1 Tax=Trichonephila clavipes TaxID=2585209 RepID=A0A8X6SQU4_TRICX|nr:uncharacterized protein TNCV_736181 [Trichonephila clavipes]
MSFANALWKAVFSGIASNTNAAIMVLQLKCGSSEKTTWCQSGTLARNPRYSRRLLIDEAVISTPVAVDQRAPNCLEEAVRSFTAMRIRCRLSCADVTFRHLLPVFRVVGCSWVHCFQTRITVELLCCTRAPIVR